MPEPTVIRVPPLAELVAPEHTALLLIDVQQTFSDEAENQGFVYGVREVIANLEQLVGSAGAAGVLRVFVRAVESDSTNTPVWISRHVTKPYRLGKYLDGSPGAEFHPRLRPDAAAGDVAITKMRYSAFLGTDLEERLRERGITTLVIGGIATNICVQVTACDAFQRDYWTLIVGDATTTRSPEEQARALSDAERNWGLIVKTEDVVDQWRAVRGRDSGDSSS